LFDIWLVIYLPFSITGLKILLTYSPPILKKLFVPFFNDYHFYLVSLLTGYFSSLPSIFFYKKVPAFYIPVEIKPPIVLKAPPKNFPASFIVFLTLSAQ